MWSVGVDSKISLVEQYTTVDELPNSRTFRLKGFCQLLTACSYE